MLPQGTAETAEKQFDSGPGLEKKSSPPLFVSPVAAQAVIRLFLPRRQDRTHFDVGGQVDISQPAHPYGKAERVGVGVFTGGEANLFF